MNNTTIDLLNILKQEAKKSGLTQQQLAKKLNTSLATLKRWLSGEGISLDTTLAIANVLGLSLADIASKVDDQRDLFFNYTEKQELYFSKNPDALAFFDYLLKNFTVKRIKKRFNLSDAKVSNFLSKLDKLELIEWHPNNKVKLLTYGEPRWKKDGHLSKILKPQIWNDFISGQTSNNSSFSLHEILDEDALTIKSKLNNLLETIRIANKKATIKNQKSKSYGLYFCFRDFRWQLDQFLK